MCVCVCVYVCVVVVLSVVVVVSSTGVGYNHGVCPNSLRASRARTTFRKGSSWCSSSPSRNHELLTGIAEAGMGGSRRSKVLSLCVKPSVCVSFSNVRALIHLPYTQRESSNTFTIYTKSLTEP
jgi:hypothetical protein